MTRIDLEMELEDAMQKWRDDYIAHGSDECPLSELAWACRLRLEILGLLPDIEDD
jgi:hypothetical protein